MEVEEEEEVRVALSLLGKTRLQMFRYGAISVEETSRSHPRNVVAVPAASCRLHRRQKPQPVGDLGGRRRGRGHEANLSMFFSFFFLFCFCCVPRVIAERVPYRVKSIFNHMQTLRRPICILDAALSATRCF